MKVKDVLFIIIGIITIVSPILAFKSLTIEYGNNTEPLLIGFRLLFIFGGLTLIAIGAGNIADTKRGNTSTPPSVSQQ